MKYYAVIDTNVLVSALITKNVDSATYKIFEKLINKEIIPLYSSEILDEYNMVLRRKKFGIADDELSDLMYVITSGVNVSPTPTGEVLTDPGDIPFYEVVMEKRDDGAYLVTGNIRHFPVKHFIVTPAEFIKIIEQNG